MYYENEIWKDIPNYEGLYQISNYGRIKSLSKKIKNKNGYKITKDKIMKNILANNGYFEISLHKNKKTKQKKYGKPVKQLTMDGKVIAIYCCIREAYRKTNIGRKEITKVCLKKYKQAGGYRWEYV